MKMVQDISGCGHDSFEARYDPASGMASISDDDFDSGMDCDDHGMLDEDADVDYQIEYLSVKQALLQRASHAFHQEEEYNAASALRESSLLSNTKTKEQTARENIWSDAKRYLASDECEAAETKASARMSRNIACRPLDIFEARPLAGCPRDPSIDTQICHQTYACDYASPLYNTRRNAKEKNSVQPSDSDGTQSRESHWLGTNALRLLGCVDLDQDNSWIAGAILEATTALTTSSINKHMNRNRRTCTSDYSWRLVWDSWNCISGLAPPFQTLLTQYLSLADAIAVCTTARLVCTAVPPFVICYANKACFELIRHSSDAGASSEKEETSKKIANLVGRPVDDIVQRDCTANSFLRGLVVGSTPCQVDIVPVVDAGGSTYWPSKRTRSNDGDSHTNPTCHPRTSPAYMSHVVVALEPLLSVLTVLVDDDSDTVLGSETGGPDSGDEILGTVG